MEWLKRRLARPLWFAVHAGTQLAIFTATLESAVESPPRRKSCGGDVGARAAQSEADVGEDEFRRPDERSDGIRRLGRPSVVRDSYCQRFAVVPMDPIISTKHITHAFRLSHDGLLLRRRYHLLLQIRTQSRSELQVGVAGWLR